MKPLLPAAEFVNHAIGPATDALRKHRLAEIVIGVAQHVDFSFVFEATARKVILDALWIDAVQRLAGFLGITSADRYVIG